MASRNYLIRPYVELSDKLMISSTTTSESDYKRRCQDYPYYMLSDIIKAARINNEHYAPNGYRRCVVQSYFNQDYKRLEDTLSSYMEQFLRRHFFGTDIRAKNSSRFPPGVVLSCIEAIIHSRFQHGRKMRSLLRNGIYLQFTSLRVHPKIFIEVQDYDPSIARKALTNTQYSVNLWTLVAASEIDASKFEPRIFHGKTTRVISSDNYLPWWLSSDELLAIDPDERAEHLMNYEFQGCRTLGILVIPEPIYRTVANIYEEPTVMDIDIYEEPTLMDIGGMDFVYGPELNMDLGNAEPVNAPPVRPDLFIIPEGPTQIHNSTLVHGSTRPTFVQGSNTSLLDITAIPNVQMPDQLDRTVVQIPGNALYFEIDNAHSTNQNQYLPGHITQLLTERQPNAEDIIGIRDVLKELNEVINIKNRYIISARIIARLSNVRLSGHNYGELIEHENTARIVIIDARKAHEMYHWRWNVVANLCNNLMDTHVPGDNNGTSEAWFADVALEAVYTKFKKPNSRQILNMVEKEVFHGRATRNPAIGRRQTAAQRNQALQNALLLGI